MVNHPQLLSLTQTISSMTIFPAFGIILLSLEREEVDDALSSLGTPAALPEKCVDTETSNTLTTMEQLIMDVSDNKSFLTKTQAQNDTEISFDLYPTGIMKRRMIDAHWTRIGSNGFLDFPKI